MLHETFYNNTINDKSIIYLTRLSALYTLALAQLSTRPFCTGGPAATGWCTIVRF
jgi:hypothetical protein